MVVRRIFVLLWGITSSAAGQETARPPSSFLNQQSAIQDQIREDVDLLYRANPLSKLDYGGWYSPYLLLFDDGIESSRTLRRHDLRLWVRASLEDGRHEVYARVRLSAVDFNSGDAYDGDDDDVEGPAIERGYYRVNLTRVFDSTDDGESGPTTVLQLGRDLATVGTGLTLATVLDQAQLEWNADPIRLRVFAGRSVGSEPDFDRTRPLDRSRRAFFGGEITWTAGQRHEPFAYVLWQRDHNSENRRHLFQEYDYDSFYAGAGSRGELSRRFRYLAEGVFESGENYGARQSFHSSHIQAWAFDAQLEYLAPGPREARASVEYLFGGGDRHRTTSPTDTIGGRRGASLDSSFVGFGFRDTGLAFAPRYSNLHMWRAGASLRPWSGIAALSRLEVGTDWFLYCKHHREAAVSDSTADERSTFLGWEADGFANWSISSDVAATLRLGVFGPGDAFSDRSMRAFVLVGITWAF